MGRIDSFYNSVEKDVSGMNDDDVKACLDQKCKWVRQTVVKMLAKAQSGHPGSALSEVEILVALYYEILNIKPELPDWPDRDRFILSKGHGCPSLYAVLADKGYFEEKQLWTLRQYKSILQGHPSIITPGIDSVSGSLGNGLSIGVGMAMAAKKQNKDFKVYVLLGDGELQEGCIWEAAMCAAHNKLNNLIAVVDYNKLQINGFVNDIVNLEPLRAKWESFNWNAMEVDGHDVMAIIHAIKKSADAEGPTVIIANTIKGKGVSFMENNYIWHGSKINSEQLKIALSDLGDHYEQ